MPLYVSRPDQHGLKHVEDNPAGKRGRMEPQNNRPPDGGVKQAFIDRSAETPDHNYSEQQRHREIKILINEALRIPRGSHRLRRRGLRNRNHAQNLDPLPIQGEAECVRDYTT